MSANEYGSIAVTGRAHCQRQVAFLVNALNSTYLKPVQLFCILVEIKLKD